MRLPAALRRGFALDTRSIALGRAAIALLLLVDLAFRATDLQAHYTDAGVLPRDALHLSAWDFLWSLHALSGESWFEALLFAATAAAAIAILAGRYTRWATATAWLLVTSLHARNPLLRDGQDDLLRVLLFWMIFLPSERSERPRTVLSFGTAAFVVQICLIYWVGAATKMVSPWWTEGNGVFYSLGLARYQTSIGAWVASLPRGLLQAANHGVIVLELAGPLLIFGAWKLRAAAVAIFVALHLSFALTLNLGIFPYLSIAGWLIFLPAEVWHRKTEPEYSRARLADPLAAAALALVIALNVPIILPGTALPKPLAEAGIALGLQQLWGLFAPNPVTPLAMSNGRFRVPGMLANGERVELFTEPENHRWRHYLANLRVTWPRGSARADTLEKSRHAWAELLCREWNEGEARHPARLVSLAIIYLDRSLAHPDAPEAPVVLMEHACSAPEAARTSNFRGPRRLL